MPGPAPKDNPLRRNKPDVAWVDLPRSGRKGAAPKPPGHVTLVEAGKSWWALAWKTPEATQWGDAELLIAGRRAEMEDLWQQDADTKLLAEMRHLETALCMTPKARKEARWRIVDDAEVGQDAGQPKTRSRSAARGKLKVVDGEAG